MTMRPSLRELGTVLALIKAKPCRAALNRAGLDNAAPRRPRMSAWPGHGVIAEACRQRRLCCEVNSNAETRHDPTRCLCRP